ncbi:MAG: nucleotidyl transferase AbiEii/AbiGii toxin family protein [Candidatus Aminicenantes bacterium]|nr:nucleotidyl transferase AbiEii/AbiGii toxin family protein [Candidatus Aminicenantes bacterium]
MIKKICFKGDWIKSRAQELGADPILIERVIFAFELLGLLIEGNINLVFKGGTSLMLLIPGFNRLSLDLDIVTNEDEKILENAFNKILGKGIFKRWEEDKRDSSEEFPKRHFKFYFDSPTMNRELYVLLDVLQTEQSFYSIIKKPIFHPIFEVEKETPVPVPSVNVLVSDKLTAFAPKTIGILYGKEKSMEIIKQLFDLGLLFEYITDMREIYISYRNFAKLESSYRNLDRSIEEFLNDSIDTSFLICQLDFRGSIENDYTRELRDGIRRIKSHILGGEYSLLKAKEDASKVACLATLIKEGQSAVDLGEIRQNRKNMDKIKNISLPMSYNILNKLKAISPESYYLWSVVAGMMK